MKISLREAPPPWAGNEPQQVRRGPAHVVGLGGPPSGSGSARGSTYWKRIMRCPREHAFSELVKLRSKYDDEALTVGFLFHHAREHYYNAHRQAQQGLTEAELRTQLIWRGQEAAERAAWNAIDPVSREPGYTEKPAGSKYLATWDQLEALVSHYIDAYRRHDRWRILATEETLRYTDPRTQFDYSARLDTLVEDYDRGGTWVVEAKTARSVTRDLIESYALDLQILGQVWLMRRVVDLMQLPPFRGVLIDIITKQKTPKLERVEVCPSEQHLQAFELSMHDWIAMHRFQSELGYPQAFGKCVGPDRGYRRCPYFDLCAFHPLKSVEEWVEEVVHLTPEGFVRVTEDDPRVALVEDGEG